MLVKAADLIEILPLRWIFRSLRQFFLFLPVFVVGIPVALAMFRFTLVIPNAVFMLAFFGVWFSFFSFASWSDSSALPITVTYPCFDSFLFIFLCRIAGLRLSSRSCYPCHFRCWLPEKRLEVIIPVAAATIPITARLKPKAIIFLWLRPGITRHNMPLSIIWQGHIWIHFITQNPVSTYVVRFLDSSTSSHSTNGTKL